MAIINAVEGGRLSPVQASTEIFHELYYVFSDYAPLHVIMADEAKIATIKNLNFITPNDTTYLVALNIMNTYRLTSIFDAIYASTALSVNVPDHTIVSTDEVYDTIRGIKRIDPRQLEI